MKREFYTVKEVAAALAISYRQTHRLLDAGELPSAYFGRLRRVPADDFDAYLVAIKEDALTQRRPGGNRWQTYGLITISTG